MHDFDLQVNLQEFLKEKTTTWIQYKKKKTSIYKFNCSLPFCLLSICSKKMLALNFINKITTLNCNFSETISEMLNSRETLPKRIAHYSNTSRPFTCYNYALKKINALNYTNKFTTLMCPFSSLFLQKRTSRENLHNHVAHSLNSSHPFLHVIKMF